MVDKIALTIDLTPEESKQIEAIARQTRPISKLWDALDVMRWKIWTDLTVSLREDAALEVSAAPQIPAV